MKNIKQQFLTAVRILAPENDLILKLAQRIPEEHLPAYPGGAALEFVATLQKFSPIRCAPVGWLGPVSPPSRQRCRAGQPHRQLTPGHRNLRSSEAPCRSKLMEPTHSLHSNNPPIH